jgi:hypothetical protein
MDKNEYLYWVRKEESESEKFYSHSLIFQGFTYKKANEYTYAIISKNLDKNGKFDPDIWIERIVVRGIRYYPRAVHLYYDGLSCHGEKINHICIMQFKITIQKTWNTRMIARID